ncbi:cytochrome c biogenesis protein ResB [Desulfococcaceae bacterium HSG8]|nr:cytochrome c biogenesis protein ResB [Desulfococcaceae bacterium HSG8]
MTQTAKTETFAAPVWRFFSSIRLTVAVLLLLAITSIIGTLIPQGGSQADYIRQYGETGYRLLYVFDLFDMYHSWWFRSLIVLLTANIVVCTLKRFPSVWKTSMAGKITLPARRDGKKEPDAFMDSRNPEALKSVYEKYIGRRFRRFRTEPIENGFRIVAERGRWTRLGVTGVHLSIVLLLAGAMIGSLFGFEGYVNIAEGERTDRIRLRNSGVVVPLDFEILCEDFDVSFYDSGAPKEYRSNLHILEDGKPVMQKDIIVNDPLRYKGINLFQSSYGSMPPKELTLSFTRQDTGKVFKSKVSVGGRVDMPGTDRQFYLREIAGDYQLRGMAVGETALGAVILPDGKSTEVALPVRFPTYDKMRKGEWIIAVEEHGHSYYTGLQVTRDPGVPLVYAGFILLILGCYVTFFMAHQKVAVEFIKSPHSSTVQVYGSSSRHPLGFDITLKKIAAELGGKNRGAL